MRITYEGELTFGAIFQGDRNQRDDLLISGSPSFSRRFYPVRVRGVREGVGY